MKTLRGIWNRFLFWLLIMTGLFIAFGFPLLIHAQKENTFYVKGFAGPSARDVATMTTLAQASCNPDTSIPCVIIFDPTLAKFAEGSLPAKCAQCIWLDYRTPSAPVSSTIDFKRLNGVRNAAQFPGADIGAQINAAYADCPAAGCRIQVPLGWYDYTTPIVFGGDGKSAILECDGDGPGVSVLHYYATTGTALSLTGNGPGKIVRGCQIKGPSTGTAIGVYVGDVVLGGLANVDISYFNVGLKFGSNTYVENFNRMFIHDNTTNILVPAGLSNMGENMSFMNSDVYQAFATGFSQSCISISSGVFTFTNSSIDQCGVTIDGQNAGMNMLGGHFESSSTTLPFVKLGPNCRECTFHAFGTKWWENGNNTGRTEFVMNASTQTNVDNEVLLVGGLATTGGETVAQLVNSTHGCCSVATVLGVAIGMTGGTITTPIGGNWANGYSSTDKGKGLFSNGLTLPNIKSTTGNRYVCVSTTGALISQATACSGT